MTGKMRIQPQAKSMTTPTTDATQQHESAETAFFAVRKKAHEAQLLLAEMLEENPDRTWQMKELYDAALERRPDLGHTAMGIAFGALEKVGLVSLDADLLVHAS
jgi:hypothetical protein